MAFDRFDICVIDFPFSDRDVTKRRPALVICDRDFIARTGNILFAMITSAKHSAWPGDCPIAELEAAGLPSACKVRMRFSTIAAELVTERRGSLAAPDKALVQAALHDTVCV
ncbi:MAG: type II toxin-antitoxin system PemK/MazF family toxin [Sphingobium sp.]